MATKPIRSLAPLSSFSISEVVLCGIVVVFVAAGMLSAVNANAKHTNGPTRESIAQELIAHEIEALHQFCAVMSERLPEHTELALPAAFEQAAKGMQLRRSIAAEKDGRHRVSLSVTWTEDSLRTYVESADTFIEACAHPSSHLH